MFGSGGFQFGNTGTTAPAASTGGFQFGNTGTAAPAASTGGFQFGNTGNTVPAASTGGFQFGNTGTTAPPPGGLQFGNTGTTALPSGGLQFGNTGTTAPPSGGLQFGSSGTAAPSGGLQFGSSTTTSAAPSFGSNFGGGSLSTASFTGSVSATTSTAPRGLGGISLTGTGLPTVSTSFSSVQGATSDTGVSAKSGAVKSLKDTPLPAELAATVETMRAHVRRQKSECEAVSRHSWTSVQRSGDDVRRLQHVCSTLDTSVQRLTSGGERLKHELSWTMRAGEVAQRTAATSAGLQYENTAPAQLFSALVVQSRHAVAAFRRQIEHVQQLVDASGGGGGGGVEQLVATMRRLHETLVWLASRLHAVHERCGQLRDQFVQLRRQHIPADSLTELAALFSGNTRVTAGHQSAVKSVGDGVGPSPFSLVRAAPELPPAIGVGSSVFAPAPSLTMNSSFLPATFGTPGSSSGLFGTGSSSAFKLEPPPGGKRNKV